MKAGETRVFEKGRVTVDPPGLIRTGSYPSYRWVICEACAGGGCPKCGRRHRSTGITYTWLGCDRCSEISLLRCGAPDQARLDDPDYRSKHGRPCRMTPGCPGRHLVSTAADDIHAYGPAPEPDGRIVVDDRFDTQGRLL